MVKTIYRRWSGYMQFTYDGNKELLKPKEKGTAWAISFFHSRDGKQSQPPAFELLAASGGRIFAKVKDKFEFYFTTIFEEFLHCDAQLGNQFPFHSCRHYSSGILFKS